MGIMNQFFSEYIYWEDYLNGMYNFPLKEDFDKKVSLSIKLLSDNNLFLHTCVELLKEWDISSRVNLTNKQCNRKAWLGHAACSFKYNSPEICTRTAWGRLTSVQQTRANETADKIIRSFELNYEKKDRELCF